VVFGVAEQLLAELRAIGGVVEQVRFRGVAAPHDPEAVKRCLDVIAKRSGVTVFYPLRTLISVDTPNLYAAGRAADGDQYAGGSLRVMGTALATGHAAGVAAALHGRQATLWPPAKCSKNCKSRTPS
jgi:hypothetical protein